MHDEGRKPDHDKNFLVNLAEIFCSFVLFIHVGIISFPQAPAFFSRIFDEIEREIRANMDLDFFATSDAKETTNPSPQLDPTKDSKETKILAKSAVTPDYERYRDFLKQTRLKSQARTADKRVPAPVIIAQRNR
ncbi:hypothetical protein HYT84_02900 [Candidatus Micrarchaeota archaeon]|nr:hypothetical protein [Candidatus Micrarchaeota archaeon]